MAEGDVWRTVSLTSGGAEGTEGTKFTGGSAGTK
jgi:hypothetical protein